MRRFRFAISGCRLPLLVAALASLAACTTLIAHRIAEPPRLTEPRTGPFAHPLERAGSRIEYAAVPGVSRLAYAVLEPGDYGFRYEFRADPGFWTYRIDYRARRAYFGAPRGTVLLAHGWSTSMLSNLHWALALAQRGWRCVLVDLRNHGRSSAAPAGFGVREGDDLAALVADLRARGRIEGPLALLGVSMGAVAAMEAATRAPDVAALVAIEPFANAADAIPAATAGLLQIKGVEPGLKRVLTSARMERVIDALSGELGLDLRALDTQAILARVDSCVAIVHGQRDTLVPVHSTRALGAGQRNVQRVELPYDGHFSTPARLDVLLDPVADWLDAAPSAPRDCPRLRAYGYAPVEGFRAVVQ